MVAFSLIGARVTASNDLTLRATRDITLSAAVGRDSESTKRTSSSVSVGISVGANAGGAGVSLNLAASRSNAWNIVCMRAGAPPSSTAS